MSTDSVAAIVLAGGRARRLGGVDKPSVLIGGVSLLARVTTGASAAGCAPILIVGSEQHAQPGARVVVEAQPFRGPVAAIAAALPLVSTGSVLLLAADLPNADALVAALVASAIPDHADGVAAVDPTGRAQWLASRIRTRVLTTAISALPTGQHDASMHELLGALTIDPIETPAGATDDADRWQDVWQARRRSNAEPKETTMPATPTGPPSARTLPPEALDEWAAALRAELGLTAEQLPTAAILDLARDVANGVARPAAPFSAFAAGLAAGLRGGDAAAIATSLATITALAAEWTPDAPASAATPMDAAPGEAAQGEARS